MKVRNAARLKSRRRSRGYTQAQLASLVGCTQQYISALEAGVDHDCSERIANRISKFLDIERDDYFTEMVVIRKPAVTTSSRGSSRDVAA
jgi:transcriptional regulator with XRE-family HTH domain